MTKTLARALAWTLVLALTVGAPMVVAQDGAAEAQDAAEAAEEEGGGAAEEGAAAAEGEAATEPSSDFAEEIVVVGSRSKKRRSVVDSPVPIDLIPAEEFNAMANTADLTDNLKTLLPSYTATPATGDGSAFVRPTSLRGLAPDQVLVLVNGKRRHRSALVHIFAPAAGNGAHGVDVGMIPGIAIKRVEVLRDGAAAQYGSDAIGGVINFQLRDGTDGGEVELQYGQHYEGEQSLKVGVNGGFALPNNGFFNISVEHVDNEALSRGVQRPDAQALIDAGVPGVGADAPFGDTPLVQTWGRPETRGTRLFFNSGLLVGGNSQLYFHGGYADTFGRYRFFYRPPDHSSLAPLRAMGFTGLPAGFTPFLDGDQTDTALVGGLTGVFGNGMTYDFSVGYGENELDYFLNNSINPDVGLGADGNPAQRDFDVGALGQEELNVNADFYKSLNDKVGLGFGVEWREETFVIKVGEPSSYLGPGVSGFRGFSPENAGSFSRDNIGVYADLEHSVSEQLLLQYAVRYEDFSDFGDTVNGKLAGRYTVSPTLTLRGGLSTGFHAPTPGQANYRQIITTFDGRTGMQVEEGLVPSTSPLVAAVGGKALTEETSVNYSAGFTKKIGQRTTLTVDAYLIQVDDRIYRTGDIPVPSTPGLPARSISFYTNAIDIESQGLDIVLTSGVRTTDISLSVGLNDFEVVGQTPVGGVNPVGASTIEDIENNYPGERFVLTTNTRIGEDWRVLARANYYGKHFDERGSIGAAVEPSFEIGATTYFDLEVNYNVNERLQLALGAVNVFDEFVDEINPPFANRQSVGLQYPRRSAANYEGGSLYAKARIRF